MISSVMNTSDYHKFTKSDCVQLKIFLLFNKEKTKYSRCFVKIELLSLIVYIITVYQSIKKIAEFPIGLSTRYTLFNYDNIIGIGIKYCNFTITIFYTHR